MKRYKFIFPDGKTFAVVAYSLSEAEQIVIDPKRLLSITKLQYY